LHLNGIGGITIGDNVLIGHRCTIFSDEHVYADPNMLIERQGRCEAPIIIEDDVYLGCNVVILKGVKIGRGAVVGAGSIVTRDVPAMAVVCGAPAKVIKHRGGGSPSA
jgi:acetyltransferase-like isoleucine patch superfamily enzyme